MFLENLQNSQENTCARASFLITFLSSREKLVNIYTVIITKYFALELKSYVKVMASTCGICDKSFGIHKGLSIHRSSCEKKE